MAFNLLEFPCAFLRPAPAPLADMAEVTEMPNPPQSKADKIA
jgi:hypothetical protein